MFVFFAEVTLRIGACCIEIAKSEPAKLTGEAHPAERSFDCQLGIAIWIDRLLRLIFSYECAIGQSVCRAGRGEYNLCDSLFAHGVEQTECCPNIIVKIAKRLGRRLTY